jgi:hypothetical protein
VLDYQKMKLSIFISITTIYFAQDIKCQIYEKCDPVYTDFTSIENVTNMDSFL